MSKPEYISIEKGLHTAKPNCFRCGDCCQIPVEITQTEADLIAKHLCLNARQMFLANITKNPKEASQTYPPQSPLSGGIGWMRAPCMFLSWEKHKGKMRAHCSIYKIRPRMCRIFYCGKEQKDEHLNTYKYTYKMDGTEDEYLKGILSELRQQRPNIRLP